MAPTRSAMLELLFNEARRYTEKANVVDHVGGRMKFIETGSIDLPRSGGKLNIGAVVEATRRVEPPRANEKWNTCLGQFRVQVGHAHDLIV